MNSKIYAIWKLPQISLRETQPQQTEDKYSLQNIIQLLLPKRSRLSWKFE